MTEIIANDIREPGLDRSLPDHITDPIPRYHITDQLWKSFTVEGVTKTISALSRHGVVLRHPAAFTVRLSVKALWDTAPDIFKGDVTTDQVQTFLSSEQHSSFYDFHHHGYDEGAVTGHYTITNSWRVHRPAVPLSLREDYIKRLFDAKQPIFAGRSCHGWWEKDWVCADVSMLESELADWKASELSQMPAWVLICCLHERTVRKVKIEPKVPRSAIAKKLAARRGENKPHTTPETILYVPKREYSAGQGGTHASPRLHYRSPHWRQQPYGPRDKPSFREVFIEGMFINAENCTADEMAEVRLSRRFKLELAEHAI